MRKTRIGVGYRLNQRIDNFALDAIGQVAGISDVFELTPAVGNFLIFDQRVDDQREDPLIRAQRRGERLGGGAAHIFVAVLQLAE